MLIENWLHPIGGMTGDVAGVWWFISKQLGYATGRLSCGVATQSRCQRIVLRRLKASEELISLAGTNEEVYLEILVQLVTQHIDDFNEVWGDKWIED